MKQFFSPSLLQNDFRFAEIEAYHCLHLSSFIRFNEFIGQLPGIDEPEVFGLNKNANI